MADLANDLLLDIVRVGCHRVLKETGLASLTLALSTVRILVKALSLLLNGGLLSPSFAFRAHCVSLSQLLSQLILQMLLNLTLSHQWKVVERRRRYSHLFQLLLSVCLNREGQLNLRGHRFLSHRMDLKTI